jgi:hypothetical protein
MTDFRVSSEKFYLILYPSSILLEEMSIAAPRSEADPRRIYASEEHARVQRRVSGFDWRLSYAWAHLSYNFGPKLSQNELVSIAELMAGMLQIKVDRDARRRKPVMIKWFEENWRQIRPLLANVILDDPESEPV